MAYAAAGHATSHHLTQDEQRLNINSLGLFPVGWVVMQERGLKFHLMAQAEFECLVIILGQARQHLEFDFVLTKRFRVLAEAKSVEPLRDVFR